VTGGLAAAALGAGELAAGELAAGELDAGGLVLDAGGLAEEGLEAGGLGADGRGWAPGAGRGFPSALAPGTRCGSAGNDDREDAAGGDWTCGSGSTGSSGGAGGSGSVLVPSESRSSDIRRACGNCALATSAPRAPRRGGGGRLSSAMATP
jgi:hypothetical protein